VVLEEQASEQTTRSAVGERRPGEELDRRAVVERARNRPPSVPIQDGDKICGTCGEGNPPTRNFCRRCGSTLADARVAHVAWWRRMFRRRRREPVAAGERPKGFTGPDASTGPGAGKRVKRGARKAFRVLVKVLGILAIVLAVVSFLPFPWAQDARERVTGVAGGAFDSARRVVAPRYEVVRPTGVVATSEDPAFPAAAAVDGATNRAWSPAPPGDGAGAVLTLTFAEPVDLGRIGFTSGAGMEPDVFLSRPRPRTVQVAADDGSTTLELLDQFEFQEHSLDLRGVTSVAISVSSVYGGATPGEGLPFAITEVEVFERA
jgi:hypothetical protein